MDKSAIINEIKPFLDGHNNDLKYLVHVEANYSSNVAECIIHPPNGDKEIVEIEYTPFLYIKDLKKLGIELYNGDKEYDAKQRIQHGIKIEKQETGNQKKLEDGYCYKVTSYKSYGHILEYFKESDLGIYDKMYDDEGNVIKNKKGDSIMPNRHIFYTVKPYEQFLIDKQARLYKGFEEYKDVHRVVFDIETTGLRYEISRVFAIGVKDNRGFETILRVDKLNDDEAEINLIRDFFNLIYLLKPAIIGGYNSEDFDFPFILGRAKKLNLNLEKLNTSLKKDIQIRRRPNSSVKIGGDTEKYTATEMWGMSIIDIYFASRRTAKINSDIKETNLKYIAKFEDVAKENRTYIPGDDNSIGRYYHENPFFLANEDNVHIEIPKEHQETSKLLYNLQNKKEEIPLEYNNYKKKILDNNPEFVSWFRKEALPQKMSKFIEGRELVDQYLLDDIWETEQIDELYNQSSFMLAKIVPTIYPKITTMGTASIWNLLLTAWSYERGLAIPHPDEFDKDIPGGLSRCYKKGYIEKLIKIDYASLYPMLQLTYDIFPIFDISGVMKKMLIYMTTTRNIYKKLGKGADLKEEEVELMKSIDHEGYVKYINGNLTQKDRDLFSVKQLPIKILNNSQFGALGANVAFNWSDNDCAARITSSGRIELRHAIRWFDKYDCVPLYAVTDGVNFKIPNKTKFKLTNEGATEGATEGVIEEMWQYGGKVGINALIEYFNDTEMRKPFMSVDNDGEFVSCYNLSRINYAVLEEVKDKKTNEIKKKIKYTGNSIKSSVMPEYIEDFYDKGFKLILEGKGWEFVNYYYDYAQEIFYKQIPLKKIASKSRYKHTLKQYLKRGKDKNGRQKAKQAHMELIIKEREKIVEQLFEEHKENLEFSKPEDKLTIEDKLKLIEVYMPPEPELDSTIFYYNTGYRKSHGDSSEVKDQDTGEKRFASTIINKKDMIENPELKGEYNADKYLDAFNKKVESMLHAFDPEIVDKILAKVVRKKVKDELGNKVEQEYLSMNQFTKDQLELKNFDLDDLEDSFYLENKEVKFWNRTGYDPRKVWNGFKLKEDDKVYYEIYENALNFLNEKMKKVNKPLIKSRNEVINKGDLVLFKKDLTYSIGRHNGDYVEIIKPQVEIPKSEIELELDEIYKKEEEKRLKNVENLKSPDLKSEKILTLEEKKEKRLKYFDLFKEEFGLGDDVNYGKFMSDAGDEGGEIIDQYIEAQEKKIETDHQKYLDVD